MNIVFSTQTQGLHVFFEIMRKIEAPLDLDKVGFYVAHSMFYNSYVKEHPELESGRFTIIREWEIESEAEKIRTDLNKIQQFEKKYGSPTIWDAIVCDRRVYLGQKCKERQDYKPSYSHEKMINTLQVALEKFEWLFDKVEPGVILSLDPVTFGDYLLYLMAKAKNIPMLFFRLSKIANYITLHEGIFGCSPNIKEYFQEYEQAGIRDEWIKKAEEYLKSFQDRKVLYEGMVPIPKREAFQFPRLSSRNIARTLGNEIAYRRKYAKDNHIRGYFVPSIYRRFLIPLKMKRLHHKLHSHFAAMDDLKKLEYVFFPLHHEPEIATLIWGKSLMNQIEVARSIARCIPPWMKLVVKDHPRTMGYRTLSYYKKILEIPNVILATPYLEVQPIIKESKMVISIASFVSFEAILYQIPTIMLGGPRPFTILPKSMVRYSDNINLLAQEVSDMLSSYRYQERPLINYIAATMRGSAPVSYFGTVLKKSGRIQDANSKTEDQEIEKMARYAIKRIREVCG